MRIVHVAPDFIPVPPAQYGGIERVVFELVQEMVKRRHEIYLYALPGSITNAELIPYQHNQNPWKILEFVRDTLPDRIDVIHDHTHGSIIGRHYGDLGTPVVCSIHVPWYNEVSHPVFPSRWMQKSLGLGAGYMIHHGTNTEHCHLCEEKADYLLFLGRLNQEKGIVQAMEIADRTNRRLIIAGPASDIVEPDKYRYYLEEVRPRLHANQNIVHVGEVGGVSKLRLLQRAGCLLFPSEAEAFGLVMIEALACGTPVLGLARGAVPEVLRGFPELICDSVDSMVNKVNSWNFPSPMALRQYAEQHFSATKMVDNYLSVYKQVLSNRGRA